MRNSINIQYCFICRLHLSRYNSNANIADMRDIYPYAVAGMQHLQSLGIPTPAAGRDKSIFLRILPISTARAERNIIFLVPFTLSSGCIFQFEILFQPNTSEQTISTVLKDLEEQNHSVCCKEVSPSE